MIAADLIAQVRDAGGQITADGADLVLTAPVHYPLTCWTASRPTSPTSWRRSRAPTRLAVPAVSAARHRLAFRRGRCALAGGPVLPDWQAYAERYRGPGVRDADRRAPQASGTGRPR